ncbi:MAG: hypothetical protein MUC43_17370 [Pirellula sp.]|jgi:hypothetical protein|nr:hypothetical protein [Pirellula sp.]
MAVPTHSNNKSTSTDGMGVPVLFSIKNVQPLILAAKPAAEVCSGDAVAANSSPSTSAVTSPSQQVNTSIQTSVELQPKARRTGLLSKVIATGFVVMLVFVVIRFSVPGSKPQADVADAGNSATGNNALSSDNAAGGVATLVTGPESNPANENAPSDVTRVASRLATPSFELVSPETKGSVPAPDMPIPDIPVLPPLLSANNAGNPSSNNSVANPQMTLQPPVASQGNSNNAALINIGESLELQTLDFPTSIPTPDVSQQDPRSQMNEPFVTQQPNSMGESNSAGNLQIVDTLTPERSLAEFEWLFRNATKNPVIPYRPVSAGGHEAPLGQPNPDQNFPAGTNPQSSASGPAAYQPLTIPAESIPPYERSNSNPLVNRYQQRIKQPQRIPSAEAPSRDPLMNRESSPAPSTAPAPYQPLVPQSSSQPPAGSTSFGYPPVQYTPITNSPAQSSPAQGSPAQSSLGQNSSVQNSPGPR